MGVVEPRVLRVYSLWIFDVDKNFDGNEMGFVEPHVFPSLFIM